MTNEEISKYIQEKWSNYTRGLAMSFAFRKDKNYTFKDMKDAFSYGAWEIIQLLIKNNIDKENLKYE